MGISEVSSPAFEARFKPSQENALNFGVTSSAIWVKCTLRNTRPEAISVWLLSLDYPLFDYVSLFRKNRASGQWEEEKSGDRYPFRNRKIAHRNFLFELPMPDTAVQTYYLRFATSGSLADRSPPAYRAGTVDRKHVRRDRLRAVFWGAADYDWLQPVSVLQPVGPRLSGVCAGHSVQPAGSGFV
ncbi:MAG: hypothetical protein IPN20_22635 [Haliscomenobacter sp.]|nr:hypothetical protein [Haliscomenobacter sp.]